MPFYRKRISFDEIAPLTQKFRTWMRNSCTVAQEMSEEYDEVFYLNKENLDYMKDKFYPLYSFLLVSKFILVAPLSPDVLIIFWNKRAEGIEPTVTRTHIRLPKLSHLITLTAEDFFSFIRVVHKSKITAAGDSLTLCLPEAGVQNLNTTNFAHFFQILRINYRMCLDYTDRKWTSRDAIKTIAAFTPTTEAHFAAMQYLTALQNPDLLYFPETAAIELELDLESTAPGYTAPPIADPMTNA